MEDIFDVEGVVERFDGDLDFFLSLYDELILTLSSKIEAARKSLGTGDLSGFVSIIHPLGGALANLGGVNSSLVARRIENSIRENHVQSLEPIFLEFMGEVAAYSKAVSLWRTSSLTKPA